MRHANNSVWMCVQAYLGKYSAIDHTHTRNKSLRPHTHFMLVICRRLLSKWIIKQIIFVWSGAASCRIRHSIEFLRSTQCVFKRQTQ